MLRIVIELDTDADPQGVKEKLAMDMEKYGDVRVVEVKASPSAQQLKLEGGVNTCRNYT